MSSGSSPDRPQALSPAFDHESPNEPISLYEGEFYLSSGGLRVQCTGTFTHEWFPRPRVRFEAKGEAELEELFNLDSVALDIPALDSSGTVYLSHLRHGSDRTAFPVAGFVSKPTWIGRVRDFDRLLFHLPNFHSYLGDAIQSGSPEAGLRSTWAGRLQLEGSEWRITLDGFSDCADRQEEVSRGGGYVLGHVGEVERADGGSISHQEADEILFATHIFLSFCRSAWCSPTLAVLVDGDQPGPARWSAPILSGWSSEPSWFPTLDTGGIGNLFSEFMSRWRDGLWQETLIHTTHWYVESNLNAGMLEGAITMAQTALEHLAWVYLVEDGGPFSTKEFKRKETAEKLRRLLCELGIPVELPDDADLEAAVDRLKNAGLDVDDGPDLLVKVRNMIVHPRRAKRRRLSELSSKQKLQVKQLGLRYIELVVLRLCSYRGPFFDRLERTSIEDRRKFTPW